MHWALRPNKAAATVRFLRSIETVRSVGGHSGTDFDAAGLNAESSRPWNDELALRVLSAASWHTRPAGFFRSDICFTCTHRKHS